MKILERLGVAGLALFIAILIKTQLSVDASAADTVCHTVIAQNLSCQVDKAKYEAQIITVDDGVNPTRAYLVVSEGGKTVTLIPIQ